MEFKLNHTPSPPDDRDHKVVLKTVASGIPAVDLSSFCTNIKNQGNVGSCTAHATVGLMEFFYKKYMSGKKDDVYSEKFVYYTTRVKVEGGKADNDSGAFLRDTLKCVVKYGACKEATFPYNSDFAQEPPEEAYKEALNFQVTKYACIPSDDKAKCLQDLKTLLYNGNAFVGGFTCYANLFDGSGGMIPIPTGKATGGHAVLFVGYDDTRQCFKFKNSWGENWGDNGYGYLPYTFLTIGALQDLWTVSAQEYDNSVFDMVNPRAVVEQPPQQHVEILDTRRRARRR